MVNSQMKQDSILAQKNFTFAAFFMPFYLALPNNCVAIPMSSLYGRTACGVVFGGYYVG